jgi:hypothetical protein
LQRKQSRLQAIFIWPLGRAAAAAAAATAAAAAAAAAITKTATAYPSSKHTLFWLLSTQQP